jgi:acylphosphatase
MDIHLNIKVFGRVQQVGYRNFICRMAIELGIKGFVENQSDGSVYIEVETTQMKADQFLEWCYKGSPLAKVSKLDVDQKKIKGFTSFEIKR